MRDDVEGEDEKSERRKDIEQMEGGCLFYGLDSSVHWKVKVFCLLRRENTFDQSNTVIGFQVIQV